MMGMVENAGNFRESDFLEVKSMMNYDETFVSVSEFAQLTGISRPTINELRRAGIIPWFGLNPVRIPYGAACAALIEHAKRNAASAAAKGAENEE